MVYMESAFTYNLGSSIIIVLLLSKHQQICHFCLILCLLTNLFFFFKKNGPFAASFFLYFRLFYKQLTVNKCSIKVADDWIRTRVLWDCKRLLCQLRHNHFPYWRKLGRPFLLLFIFCNFFPLINEWFIRRTKSNNSWFCLTDDLSKSYVWKIWCAIVWPLEDHRWPCLKRTLNFWLQPAKLTH